MNLLCMSPQYVCVRVHVHTVRVSVCIFTAVAELLG